MEKRKLGRTSIELSVLGIGTWGIGGGNWKYGWGPQDDQESIRTIKAALDKGFNWIDTAPAYGLGHAETIVGEAIRDITNKPFIATKCGLFQDKKGNVYSDISEKSIRREVEDSLKRLAVDRIDLYQIHWPNPSRQIEEAYNTLLDLVKEGKILYPAVCNFSLEQLKKISKLGMPLSLQSPLSMLRQELEYEILPWCIENSVSVLAYSPMQCGLLTGKVNKQWLENLPKSDWRHNDKFFKEPLLSSINTKISQYVESLQKSYPNKLNPALSVALQWVNSRPGVTSAIVGMRSIKQLDEIVQALDYEILPEELLSIGKLFA